MKTRAPIRTTLALAALTTLVGCLDRSVSAIEPHTDPQVNKVIDIKQERDVDILFVIDNSGSMGDEQTSLVNEFPGFMAELSTIAGGLPNVHIGVVSSNVGAGPFTGWGPACPVDGDDGVLQNRPRQTGCSPPAGHFISDVEKDGKRERNYSGTLEETFKCVAELGTDGCGFEHHMESMARALDGSRPENAGFLRPGALLAVVFIADEDDCSASDGALFDDDAATNSATSTLGPRPLRCTEWAISCDGANLPRSAGSYDECAPRESSPYFEHPRKYADFLRSLKPGRPELVLLGGIFGPTAEFQIGGEGTNMHLLPSCGSDPLTSDTGDGAVPPIRFRALFEEFAADKTIRTSICDDNLSAALELIGKHIGDELPDTCLSVDVRDDDLRDDLPGLQLECAVSETRDGVETTLPRCKLLDQPGAPAVDPASRLPCWYVAESDRCTDPDDSGLALEIARNPADPIGDAVIANCVGN